MQVGGRARDVGAGPEHGLGAGLEQRVVVRRRDDAADHDHDVAAAFLLQRRRQLRHQREVAGRQRRHADDVHVVLHRLARRLVGRGEQRPDVDVEAQVGERRGDHLLAAVVAVLAHLGDQDARPAAVVRRRTPRTCAARDRTSLLMAPASAV